MTTKYTDAFLIDAQKSLDSGLSLREFCKIHKVSSNRLSIALKDRFGHVSPVTRKRIFIESRAQDICNSYNFGVSTQQLAKDWRASRGTIYRILSENGVVLRDASKANTLRMSRLTQEERASLSKSARAAKRENLGVKAQARRNSYDIGKGENEIFDLLVTEGFSPTRQHIIGPYSIDLVFGNVAVEIKCFRKFETSFPFDRIKQIVESGHILCFFVFNEVEVIHHARNEIIALLDFVRRQPSTGGQYWVINCRGDRTALHFESNNLTGVLVSPNIDTTISKRYLC